MNKNLGKMDRALRIIVGLVVIGYGVFNNSLLGLIGLIPLGTAIIGLCPIYSLFKINTCNKENCKS